MPIDEIDIQFFKKITTENLTPGIHEIVRGRLQYSDKKWFCKTVDSAHEARHELLSQEFYRLILPEQPETRVAKSTDGQAHYVLSEEIPGFRPLPCNEQAEFVRGVYTGLGQVLMVAVFLQEIDLNVGNIGINHNNQVRKIDGGCSFASVTKAEKFCDKPTDLTAKLIDELPFLTNYYAYNWLDMICKEQWNSRHAIVDASLLFADHFKTEINQAILSLLLLPESYVNAFIKLYMPDDAINFVDVFRLRQRELRRCVFDTQSFPDYLSTPAAQAWMDHYVSHLKTFAAHQFFPVIPMTEHDALTREVDAQLARLLSEKFALIPSPVGVELVDEMDRTDVISVIKSTNSRDFGGILSERDRLQASSASFTSFNLDPELEDIDARSEATQQSVVSAGCFGNLFRMFRPESRLSASSRSVTESPSVPTQQF